MAISVSATTPAFLQDNAPPLSSYMGIGLVIELGQLILDTSSGDLYICYDNSNQNALVWNKVPRGNQVPDFQAKSDWNAVSGNTEILNKPTIPAAQIQCDWAQASSLAVDFIKNKPTRTQSNASRSLNSAFQISSTRDCFVNYSVDIACTLSLTTGQTGTVFLEIASDSGFTTNVQEISRSVNGNTGTLTIGLNLTQNVTSTLSGFVPTGYYCRIRTANTVGTPTFNYRSGQEILL